MKPSQFSRSKISASLTGRKDSEETRAKKSDSRKGANNPFFGKGPGVKAINLAAEKLGTKVYVYDVDTFTLVNNQPFRSIRMAVKAMPISESSFLSKLNTDKAFKGYFCHTKPRYKRPKN